MKRLWPAAVIASLGLYTLVMVETLLGPFFSLRTEIFIRTLGSLFLFAFSVGHALWTLGTRRAIVFMGLSFAISFFFEALGVSTGWPFGAYHYTERLGPRLLGLVPIVIPATWFMMIYPSHVVVDQIAGEGSGPSRPSPGRLAWLGMISALAMTAWDLMADPLLIRAQHWVWEVEGEFYGVPVSNYAGWLVTTFLIFTSYRWMTRHWPVRPWGQAGRGWPALPIFAYAVTWLTTSMLLFKVGLAGAALAGFFGMGGFALLGLGAPQFASKEAHSSNIQP